jgi:hypothetical protein
LSSLSFEPDILLDHTRHSQFGILSGDFNPLHSDVEYSRRSRFGSVLVHGVHILMCCLNKLPLQGRFRIVYLKCSFRSEVKPGESICVAIDQARSEYQIIATSGNKRVCRMFVQLEPADTLETVSGCRFTPSEADNPNIANWSDNARELENPGFDHELAKTLFPQLSAHISESDINFMLSITRIVGMKLPGKQALLRSVEIERTEKSGDSSIAYQLERFDPRFNLALVKIHGTDLAGRAETQIRPGPTKQQSVEELHASVNTDEFVGVRGLVVGCSRGLGELTSKILLVGGAKVLGTYFLGEHDVHQFVERFPDAFEPLRLDVCNVGSSTMDRMREFRPTHLFYFATPPIVKQPMHSWDESLFERFRKIYVDGLAVLSQIPSLVGIFNPSSIFVSEDRVDFREYVAAKRLSEAYCTRFGCDNPKVRLVVSRLPALATDQTVDVLGTDVAHNRDVILDLVRKLTD